MESCLYAFSISTDRVTSPAPFPRPSGRLRGLRDVDHRPVPTTLGPSRVLSTVLHGSPQRLVRRAKGA